ncbi:MAG TPA: biopolymer transporter ExbD, partial [Thermoleophilia bacterium]|nr:biopolymer transporter ExbD [Thermoleophilia bacterium]
MAVGLGTKRPQSDINVTPLIDVVLVLLIIFMVLTPLADKQMFMRVPEYEPNTQVVPPDQVSPDQTVITVKADGRVLLNKQELELPDAMQRLGQAYEGRPSKPLFFN